MVNPEEKYITQAAGVKMRLVEESDAEFIVDIRTNPKLGQNISWTSTKIQEQVNWIAEYKKRENNKLEYYFIFEDENDKPWGTVRLYGFTNDSFTVGSWICLPDNMEKIAIKAWLLCMDFGFEKLNFQKCFFDIRKKNKAVLYYAYLYHPALISEDELNYFFCLNKEIYFENRGKVIRLLNLSM